MSLSTGYYPRTYTAILRHLATLDGVHFVGVRVDPGAIYVQVDDISLIIPGNVERSYVPEDIVRDLIHDALGGPASPIGESLSRLDDETS